MKFFNMKGYEYTVKGAFGIKIDYLKKWFYFCTFKNQSKITCQRKLVSMDLEESDV